MSAPSHPGPRCAEIFDLARNHGLPCDADEATLGERVEAFINDYLEWVPTRDAEVERYLQATDSRYRFFLPNRPTAPSTAGAMYWYFDDLVLTDPLARTARPIPLLEFFEPPPGSGVQTTSVTPPGRHLLWPIVNGHLRNLVTVRDAMLAEKVIVMAPPAIDTSQPGDRTALLDDLELRTALTQNYVCSSRLEVIYGSVLDAHGRPSSKAATWVFRRIDNGFGKILIVAASAPKSPRLVLRGCLFRSRMRTFTHTHEGLSHRSSRMASVIRCCTTSGRTPNSSLKLNTTVGLC